MSEERYDLYFEEEWIASFEKLRDLMLFEEALCQTYYKEIEFGITFKVVKFYVDDNGNRIK